MTHKNQKRVKRVFIAFFAIFSLFFMIFCIFFTFFPQKYKNIIKIECEKYNLEPALICAMINAESRFDKNAQSKKGACGLMQLLPSTAIFVAEQFGEDFDLNNLFEPETNIKYGTYYFNYLYQKFENLDTAICAYNAGETTVRNWLGDEQYSKDGFLLDFIPYLETQNYLQKVKTNYQVYKKFF